MENFPPKIKQYKEFVVPNQSTRPSTQQTPLQSMNQSI